MCCNGKIFKYGSPSEALPLPFVWKVFVSLTNEARRNKICYLSPLSGNRDHLALDWFDCCEEMVVKDQDEYKGHRWWQ